MAPHILKKSVWKSSLFVMKAILNFQTTFELLPLSKFCHKVKTLLICKQGGNGNIGLSTQNVVTSSVMTNGTSHNRTTSKTAPARLEGFDDDEEEDNALFKVHRITINRTLSVFKGSSNCIFNSNYLDSRMRGPFN